MGKTVWFNLEQPHNNLFGYFEEKPSHINNLYECSDEEFINSKDTIRYRVNDNGELELMSDELFNELFPNYDGHLLKGNALQERKYTTYDNQIQGLSSQDDFLEECLVEMATIVYGSETQKVLKGGEDKVMAMLFAQRVILGKTLYKDVPAQLKSQVKEILIDSGMEFLIEE